MNEWLESLQSLQLSYLIIAALCAIVVVLVMMQIALSVKLSRLKKTFVKMKNSTNMANVEQLLDDYKQTIEQTILQAESQQTRIEAIESTLKSMSSKISVKRYNAFGERGNDLSFSVAFMSEQQDGVVLSGIHNREETHMYAKPIVRGKSEYRLTPEEEEVINQCSELVLK